jgi:hypothetical protein
MSHVELGDFLSSFVFPSFVVPAQRHCVSARDKLDLPL